MTMISQSESLRVLVVDDHPLVVAAVGAALEEDGYSVVGTARSGAEVLPKVRQSEPDVVLLDVDLPEVDGVTCLARIRERHPATTVVMFSAATDDRTVGEARAAGASAYVHKSLSGAGIAEALSAALATDEFVVFGDEQVDDRDPTGLGLSERELTMLETLVRGLSNRAIGKELWITEQTVKFHLTNIYRKLGVENRTQAVRYAYEHRLVPIGRSTA